MKHKSDSKVKRGKISITLKMFAYLALFTAVSLLVVWIFQVRLLDKFYEKSKFDELKDAEKALAEYIDDEEQLEINAYKYSMDYTMGIAIYRMDGATPTEIYHRDVGFDSVLSNLSSRDVLAYSDKAEEHGGTYQEFQEFRIGKPGGDIDDGKPNFDNIGNNIGKVTNTLYIGLEHDSDGNEYVIMLDVQMTPFNATVITQKFQFVWIAVCMLVVAVVLTFVISNRIIRPIVQINQSAKALADGDYNVKFTGRGYREVNQLSDTLNYAASELAKADNLQKELIANVSHDLRTPLTMIEGYVEMMRDIPGENSPENLQVVLEESQRLSELVSDLLDLSRLRAGTRKLEFERFNLTDTVNSVMNRYDKLTHRDGYTIEYNYDKSVDITADRTGLLQVIYNLINNAINYAGSDKYVCVTQKVIGNKVRLSISDHGNGIAADQIPLIWDRYYKVDSVHKRARVGTGLGLSIVKGVLEMHGFGYGVESKVGEGSIFWFEMPITE